MNTKISISLAAAVLLTVSPPRSAAEDWPFLRGPEGTGISTQKLDPAGGEPERLWKISAPRNFGGAVVVDGLVYVFGTGPVNLLCVRADSGEEVWKKGDLGEWYGQLTPTVADGEVYVMAFTDKKPKALCYDAKSGEELWIHEMPAPGGKREYGHAGSPLIVGDLVIFNAGGGVALKKDSGEVVWEHEGFPGLATPAIYEQGDGKKAVGLFLGDRLIGRDLASGEELWSIPWKTNLAVNAHIPVFFDGKVFINSDYGLGRALYEISGAAPVELWKFNVGSGHAYSASIYHDGFLYGFFEHNLACLDPKDGSLRWKDTLNGSLLLIDGKLVCLSKTGELQIAPVSPDGWEPTVVAQVNGGDVKNNPAYFDGKLISKNSKGDLVCVRISK